VFRTLRSSSCRSLGIEHAVDDERSHLAMAR
jgi:hypothetical protein